MLKSVASFQIAFSVDFLFQQLYQVHFQVVFLSYSTSEKNQLLIFKIIFMPWFFGGCFISEASFLLA